MHLYLGHPSALPSTLVWEGAVSLQFLDDINFCISDSALLLLCPPVILQTRTRSAGRWSQRDPEPSPAAQTLPSYSGTAGTTQQKSIKHSGESPSVAFVIITKKAGLMWLLRHGAGHRVLFILSKGRKWVIDFLCSQTGAGDWLVEWALASQ